jgi:Na+/H+ antiporter NhaD/arsenite permease-like protein
MTVDAVNIASAAIFMIAVLHTFSAKYFESLAHKSRHHAGFWHLLGEVEIVFGFWALVLTCFLFAYKDKSFAVQYLEAQNYTEPVFVFVVMVISASKPIFDFCLKMVLRISNAVPFDKSITTFFVTLSLIPLLGSFITEPAAMTLAALMLKKNFYERGISSKLMYATVGVLFVNISIGGTLTPYAAPPILMVAAKWNWDFTYMIQAFGWRSTLAVILNALILTFLFRSEIKKITFESESSNSKVTPLSVIAVHLLFLAGVVFFAHHTVIFVGLFLFFIGFTTAYEKYQSKLLIRESLLVGFFLAGLVVLGGQQKWWLEPLLTSLNPDVVYYGAIALTAITDNAALTYLGSLVEGLSDEFKYALVAGAVTGGGLTVIANAPNPAGYSILKSNFEDGVISPLLLFINAIPPTLTAVICFKFL